jgi:hypothetical protein
LLADRYRRARRILAILRRRDPKPWVVALVAMALGLSTFLFLLALVEVLRLVAQISKSLR